MPPDASNPNTGTRRHRLRKYHVDLSAMVDRALDQFEAAPDAEASALRRRVVDGLLDAIPRQRL